MSNWLAFRHHIFLTPGLNGAANRSVGDFDIVHLHEYRTLQNAVVGHAAAGRGRHRAVAPPQRWRSAQIVQPRAKATSGRTARARARR